MQTPLDYAEEGGIVTLTMNMPDIRNAISSPEMIDALVDACERLNADMNARVAILTGAGTAFSSGGNVKKMLETGETRAELPAQTRRNYRLGIQRIPLAFDALEVPIIAAVNGVVSGIAEQTSRDPAKSRPWLLRMSFASMMRKLSRHDSGCSRRSIAWIILEYHCI